MEQKFYIYKITNNINGLFYIGKRCFKGNIKEDNYFGSGLVLNRAIKKYGKNNFTKEIIDIASSKKELSEKEVFWINKLDSKFPRGYNLTEGGDGIQNTSIEIRSKISKSLKTYFSDDNVRKSLSKKCSKIHKTEEHKNKISLKLKGVKKTEEHNKNVSKSLKIYFSDKNNRDILSERMKNVYNNNPELREKVSERMKKPVFKFDKNGNFLEKYSSLDEALFILNKTSKGNLSSAASGKRNFCYGFRWSFGDKPNELLEIKKVGRKCNI